jgi:hypothetical protein
MNNVIFNKDTYIDAIQQNIPSSNLPKNFLCFCTIATFCPILKRIDQRSKSNIRARAHKINYKTIIARWNKMDEKTYKVTVYHTFAQ